MDCKCGSNKELGDKCWKKTLQISFFSNLAPGNNFGCYGTGFNAETFQPTNIK